VIDTCSRPCPAFGTQTQVSSLLGSFLFQQRTRLVQEVGKLSVARQTAALALMLLSHLLVLDEAHQHLDIPAKQMLRNRPA